MRRACLLSSMLLLGACGAQIDPGTQSNNLGGSDASTGGGDIDAGTAVDAGTSDAALGPYGPAQPITVAATTKSEDDETLSSTGLEMIFAIDGGAMVGKDLYYTSRPSLTGAWTTPVKLSFNSDTKSDETPRFSADDKTLYYASARNNNDNTLDLYSVKRDAVGSTTWSAPNKNNAVSTANNEKWYMPCGTQYLAVQDTAGNGVYHFIQGTQGNAGTPVPELTAATGSETGTFFTPDCKTVYFASTRTTPTMIYMSTRDTVDSKWKTPTAVTDLKITGGNGNEEDPWMSADTKIFTFVSDVVTANLKDVYITVRQ